MLHKKGKHYVEDYIISDSSVIIAFLSKYMVIDGFDGEKKSLHGELQFGFPMDPQDFRGNTIPDK